jgi:hypothetical protein
MEVTSGKYKTAIAALREKDSTATQLETQTNGRILKSSTNTAKELNYASVGENEQ